MCNLLRSKQLGGVTAAAHAWKGRLRPFCFFTGRFKGGFETPPSR